MPQKNYYSILGIRQTATAEEIKKAYRRLAFRYHPDHNSGGIHGEERFREVKEAYEVLSNPIRRHHHDAALRAMHVYAPSYEFAKFSTPSRPKEPAVEDLQMKGQPEQAASGFPNYLKPIIFIIVAALLMLLIARPPQWMEKILNPTAVPVDSAIRTIDKPS